MNVKDIIKPLGGFGPQGFLIGLGVAAVAYFLAPHLKKAVQPLIDKGAEGVSVLGGKIMEMKDRKKEADDGGQSEAAEAIEVPAANAQSHDIMPDKLMVELKDAIVALKDEVAQLKTGLAGAKEAKG